MYFVDSTGHTFHQPSFNYEPIGYEYYKNKYIFWIDNKDHSYCSINNYYIRPIYILSDSKIETLKITINSSVFSLLSSRNVAERFVNGTLSINEWDLSGELNYNIEWEGNEDIETEEEININDILELEVTSKQKLDVATETEPVELNKQKYIYPFYVIGNSPEVGAIMTNVLIRATYIDDEYVEYCYITVGGEFNEESEILYINGQNMGVNLPHEIIRAVYNGSYVNGEFDEILYNEKLKEYLLEYMQIRGQIGNYNSAIQSLKWFGWGKHVDIVSLLQTDNQFMVQFVRDYFDTDSDILDSFKHFVNSTLLSLIIWENKETGEYNPYNLNADFIGENQPELEDLFSKQIKVLYGGVGEETYYYRNYYDFMFGELMYKFAALKFYYETYFLPVHLSIHNASLHHKVYANDMKMVYNSTEHIAEPIYKIGLWDDPWVEFPKNNEIWLTDQVHYVDELYNEWKYDNLNEYAENKDIYYIHDTCCNIPIKFLNYTIDENENIIYNDEAVDVHLLLEKITSESDNVLYLNTPINLFEDDIHLYDITGREIDLNETHVSYSVDGGRVYSTYFYGLNALKEIKTSDNTITVNLLKQINDNNIECYVFEYKVNDVIETFEITDKEQLINIENNGVSSVMQIPSLDDIHVDVFNNSAECNITVYDEMLLRIKIPNDKISKCEIEHNDTLTDITKDITIKYSPTSEIFYESDFTFNCAHDEYNDLVIYPKMFNNIATDTMYNRHGRNLTNKNIDITYFINSKFRLRMLINNKWHEYEFIIRMPDINIDFGKLIYKYYDDELKYTTKFNQLSELTDDELRFNAFMHEPRMTRINDINFLENFLKYINISTARYIDGNIIPTGEFCQYIDVTITDEGKTYTQRVYVSNDNIGQDLIIPRRYFNYDVLFYLFLDKKMLYIFADTGNNNTYEILNTEVGSLIFEDNDTVDDENNLYHIYNDINNYKRFVYNAETNQYEVETSMGILKFDVKESLRSDVNTFSQQYIETHNITNKYKYLNQIHVFDLYRLNDHKGDNLISLQNNIDMHYHGIRFTHKSFLNGNLIHISGKKNNLITNSNVRSGENADNKTFKSSLDPNDDSTIYDSYINTYDDLTIYSAYEGDWLKPMTDETSIAPSGYVYYEQIDNGIPTGIYTTSNISIIGHSQIAHISIDNGENYVEYVDVKTFAEFENIIQNTVKLKYLDDNSLYDIKCDGENNDGPLYIDRENIDTPTTPVQYTAEIIMVDAVTNSAEVINPTCAEYYNTIRTYFTGERNSGNDAIIYKLRIRFNLIINKIENNIQRVYTGEAEYNNGVYGAFINGEYIVLTPFYSEYDHNRDELFHVNSLIQQPGFDWIDINDLDNTIQYINYNAENDYIDLSDPSNVNDSDIAHILSYRKLLILNVTTRMLNALRNYEATNIYNDYVNILKKDETQDKINIRFKIYTNQNEGEDINNDGVEIKTVLRCKYLDGNKEKYDYFDDEFEFETTIKKEDIINEETGKVIETNYNIDCGKDDDNKPYINTIIDGVKRQYVDFVVFFVIVPESDSILNDVTFSIDINPEIRLVYKDYDILEYPTDSFIKTGDDYLSYETDDFVNYNINDVSYKYGDCRESEAVCKLYNEFFEKRTVSYNDIFSFTSIDAVDELNIDKDLVEYDMYLMHNTKSWYIVYISKDTCDKSLALYNYEIDDDEIVFMSKENKQYKLIRNTSVKKFLINRYVYVSKDGKYHFNTDDIIVGKVLNNERLPIDIFKSSKWELSPVSFALDKMTHTSSSNIDMCIFDVPMYNDEYVKGYYDVTYRYSLDRISTQQYKKYGTILIE